MAITTAQREELLDLIDEYGQACRDRSAGYADSARNRDVAYQAVLDYVYALWESNG